jgi:acylphosphatase
VRRVHAIVTGDVQGVGYRYSMRHVADEAGVVGWVRNRHDGAVEAEIEGTSAQVDAMLAWMRRGPHDARPTAVHATDLAPTGAGGFEIRPSA